MRRLGNVLGYGLGFCLGLGGLLAGPLGPAAARAQCILANPSFELPGSGGTVFGGWNQFGVVGSSANASHGSVAARVSGPGGGDWGVSAFWQRLDSVPGDRWAASVPVWHSAANPLGGQSQAIVNIEWRDAAGVLLDYESHAVADAATPPDEIRTVTVVSEPAPVGTAATHFLLGVLQGPTDPSPDVFYDQVTFEEQGPPTPEEGEWGDFPGGRTVDFAGRSWRVKGPGYYGPGPNLFDDGPRAVWVDASDRLHLTIRRVAGSWYSSEIALEEALGYGDYVFTTVGRIDALDPVAVFGLFLWQYGPCFAPENLWWNPHDEFDLEFSRWGDPGNDPAQFVAQPWDFPGNVSRFDASFVEGELASHAFRWMPDRMECRSWRGGPDDDVPANRIHEWTYSGPHLPRPERPRVHLNLWQFGGPPAADQEVVLAGFRFVPEGGAVDAPAVRPPGGAEAGRVTVLPNPFRGHTRLRFSMPRGGRAEVAVHDVAGRLVRSFDRRGLPVGDHELVWDGRDAAGNRVASGVYLVRFRTDDAAETHRVVRVR